MANEKKDSTAKKSATPAKAAAAKKATPAKAITNKLAIIAEEDERRAEVAQKLAEIAKLESAAKIAAAVQKMTIKETREVMRFAVALVQAYKAAIADGSITGTDVQFLIMPITLLVPAVSGANLIAAEMADLDEVRRFNWRKSSRKLYATRFTVACSLPS